MIKKSELKLVDKIIDAICPLPQLFGLFAETPDNDDVWDENYPEELLPIVDTIQLIDPCADVLWGMSKLVISSPKMQNFVIKIPFNGYELLSGWYGFEGAPGSDCSDYCLAEYEKYKKLRTYGLNCFVVKTVFYKKVDGVRFFLQEKAICVNSDCTSRLPSQKSLNLAEKWYREGRITIDPDWIASCIDFYGKARVKRFLYYCEHIDADILMDMHGGNFGYRKNGSPVLIDFSNFSD